MVEEVLIKHYWLEAVVPKVNIDIVDGHIDLALVTPHEVELVNDGYFQHPVLPWITLDHSGKLINLDYEAWAEAVWVQFDGRVAVHASFDTGQEVVGLVEPEVHCLIVDQVRNLREVMFIWLLFFIETVPEIRALLERIIIIISGFNEHGERDQRE